MSYAVEAYDGELKDLRRFICESNHESRLMELELRKTKHALWMARALRAEEHTFIHAPKRDKWEWVERKCREKAKEFE